MQRHHLHEDGDPRFKIHATSCDAIVTTTLKRSLMFMKETFYLSEWSGWILRSMLHWVTSSFEHQCPPKMQQHPPSAMLAQAYRMAINTLVKIGQAISDALYHAHPQKVILCFGFEKVWLKMHNFKSSQPKVEEIGFTGIVGKKNKKTNTSMMTHLSLSGLFWHYQHDSKVGYYMYNYLHPVCKQ